MQLCNRLLLFVHSYKWLKHRVGKYKSRAVPDLLRVRGVRSTRAQGLRGGRAPLATMPPKRLFMCCWATHTWRISFVPVIWSVCHHTLFHEISHLSPHLMSHRVPTYRSNERALRQFRDRWQEGVSKITVLSFIACLLSRCKHLRTTSQLNWNRHF